jgi:hypothetical protein
MDETRIMTGESHSLARDAASAATETTQDALHGLPPVPADPLLSKRVKVSFGPGYEGPWAFGIEGRVRAVSRSKTDDTYALLIETKTRIAGEMRSRASMVTVRPVDRLDVVADPEQP